jgi:hypothetical protein
MGRLSDIRSKDCRSTERKLCAAMKEKVYRMKNNILLASALCLLSSCVQPSASPANASFACDSSKDCDQEWSKAIEWIVQNSAYRIQIQTDNIIQTYGPDQYVLLSGFLINRVNNADGSGTITFNARCGNQFRCSPAPDDLGADFGNFITQK